MLADATHPPSLHAGRNNETKRRRCKELAVRQLKTPRVCVVAGSGNHHAELRLRVGLQRPHLRRLARNPQNEMHKPNMGLEYPPQRAKRSPAQPTKAAELGRLTWSQKCPRDQEGLAQGGLGCHLQPTDVRLQMHEGAIEEILLIELRKS